MFSTHIFDGLEDWGTHITHISNGKLGLNAPICDIPELGKLRAEGAETVGGPCMPQKVDWSFPDAANRAFFIFAESPLPNP
jgi:hypothetical protein